MKIKNLIGLMAATVFMMGAFAGCGANSAESASSAASKDGISVVTTIFPEYDWVKEIAGDAKFRSATFSFTLAASLMSGQRMPLRHLSTQIRKQSTLWTCLRTASKKRKL